MSSAIYAARTACGLSERTLANMALDKSSSYIAKGLRYTSRQLWS